MKAKSKILLLFGFILLPAFVLYANDIILRVNYKDGRTGDIILSQRPVVQFNNDNLEIEIEGLILSYKMEELSGYKLISDVSSGVKYVTETPIHCDGHTVYIGATDKASDITVYNLAGIRILQKTIEVQQEETISIDEWESGVYIIKYGSTTYKFIKP